MNDEDLPVVGFSGEDLAQTLELTNLFTTDVTTTGSFDVRGEIWKTTFGKVMQALPLPTLLVDQSYHITVVNQAWGKISPDYKKLEGSLYSLLFPGASAAKNAQSILEEVFSTRKSSVVETVLEIEGSKMWGRMTLRSIRIGEKRFVLILTEDLTVERKLLDRIREHEEQLGREVKERTAELLHTNEQLKAEIRSRKIAQEALQESSQKYRELAEMLPQFIYEIDEKGFFTFVNKAGLEATGYSRADIKKGLSLADVFGPEDWKAGSKEITKILSGETVGGNEYTLLRKDGSSIKTVSYSCPITREGKVVGIRGVGLDVTERKREEVQREKLIADLTSTMDALRVQASRDGLTGLWNRTAVFDILNGELTRAGRGGSYLGVLIADIDHFKRINDDHGHLTGDAVLREVAARIVSAVRPYDSVGRYGGEEFVVVAPDCDTEEARLLAERLCSDFRSNPVKIPEGSFDITVSLGVMSFQGKEGWNVDSVVRAADEALYRAKRKGRGRVELWHTS